MISKRIAHKHVKHFFLALTLLVFGVVPYHTASAQLLVTNSYTYTGSMVSVLVPQDATSVYFELLGASGGNASGNWTVYGGQGAFLSGTMSISENLSLYLFVGGAGSDSTIVGALGGFNGGGNGQSGFGGGGGGATDMRVQTFNLESRAAVAGGGGGANTAGGFGGAGGNVGVFTDVLGVGGSGQFGGGGGGYYGGFNAGSGGVSRGQGGSSFWANPVVQNAQSVSGADGTSISKANGSAPLVFSVVPEPKTYALVVLGGALVCLLTRRKVS